MKEMRGKKNTEKLRGEMNECIMRRMTFLLDMKGRRLLNLL